MSDEQKKSEGFLHTLGNTGDKIVGDMFLGSIGVAGYHLGKVKPIGATGAYIRDNVRDGFDSAAYEDLKRSAAKKLAVTLQGGLPLTSEQIEQGLRSVGVQEDDIASVKAAAERRVTGKKADVTPPMPAEPAQVPPVPAEDVPLPLPQSA